MSHVSQLPPREESDVLRQRPSQLCRSGVPAKWALAGAGSRSARAPCLPSLQTRRFLQSVGGPGAHCSGRPRSHGLTPSRSGTRTCECRCTGPHTRGSLLSECRPACHGHVRRGAVLVKTGDVLGGAAPEGAGGRDGAPGAPRGRSIRREPVQVGEPRENPVPALPRSRALSCGSSSQSTLPGIQRAVSARQSLSLVCIWTGSNVRSSAGTVGPHTHARTHTHARKGPVCTASRQHQPGGRGPRRAHEVAAVHTLTHAARRGGPRGRPAPPPMWTSPSHHPGGFWVCDPTQGGAAPLRPTGPALAPGEGRLVPQL